MLISSKHMRPQGLATTTDPDGVVECDTFRCGHCQKIVLVKPKSDPAAAGGLCKICMRLTCPRCTDKGHCKTWEDKMFEEEAREIALRSYGL